MTTGERPPAPPASFAEDDLQQLRLLAVFHYVAAGLVALLSLLPGFQLLFGLLMASGRLNEDEGARVFGFLIAGCAAFLLFTGLGLAAAVALAGQSIARRRRYTYVLVVAGVLCVFVPLGTILGVLTFVVLVRPPVRASFAGEAGLAR